MRKHQKQEILDFVSNLYEAHKEIDNALQIGRIAECQNMLCDCQECAIELGNIIENFEGQGAVTVSYIEKYCELLYHYYEKLNQTVEIKFLENNKIIKQVIDELNQQLCEIENSIKNDIKIKKEIVFFPYKASMWDSLESIYLAAKEDESCDVYCVPIPYYDKNPDGSFGKMYYEGNEYPEGIEVINWKIYDIKERRPDVVYIHNPYDDYNRVTSVPPAYFTRELKKYCETLVYVPYFFTGKVFPSMHLSFPTYQNMDYIVLPSEEAKEQMKEYVPEHKLLALGSPKIDTMLRLKELKEIPEEWKDRIRGRKTVLYNVGLGAILSNGFQTILKMRYIFNYFKQQNDLVLWWRPHPLMKSTLKSMRPELLGAYEEMENAFIHERIGIYDTTADSNKAVAATDAFLGDSSSMCALYGIMGKPIFLTGTTAVDEPTEEERRKLWLGFPGCEPYILDFRTYPVADEKGNMFFYSYANRLFGKVSKDMKEVQVCARFEEDYCRVQAFYTTELEKMEIHFYPTDQKKPGKIYHVAEETWTETNSFVGIPLAQYGAMTEYKNYWIIAPGRKSEFLYVNKRTGEKHAYSGYESVLKTYCQMPEEQLFGGGFLQLGSYIYMLAYRVNKLLEFNLQNKSWKFYDIGNVKDRFSAFWYDDVDFWFLAWDGSHIVKWNKETGKADTYSDMPKGFEGMNYIFSNQYTPAIAGAFYNKNKKESILIPYTANMLLKLNQETGEITPWEVELPYEEGQRKSSLYCIGNNYGACLYYEEDKLMMQTSYDGSILLIDLESKEVKRAQCTLSKEDYDKYRVPIEQQNIQCGYDTFYSFRENAFTCTLKDMMDYFASGADMKEERQYLASTEGVANADGSSGRKIHEYLLKI